MRTAQPHRKWVDGAADAAADLRLWAPFEVIEKADAPPGQKLRIRGVFSTEHPDLQGEIVEQDGMDLGPVRARGWLNDNHNKTTGTELGIPTRFWRTTVPGPDGKLVKATAFEGFLLDTPAGRRIFENAKALRGTGRGYGFSIEGKTLARRPGAPHRIAKSVIREIAVTRCPVNPFTQLDTLEKSLAAVMAEPEAPAQARRAGHRVTDPDALEKAVQGAIGQHFERLVKAATGGSLPVPGAQVPGDVAPVVGEDLEGGTKNQQWAPGGVPMCLTTFFRTGNADAAKRAAQPRKRLTKSQAEAAVRARLPGATDETVRRVLHQARSHR